MQIYCFKLHDCFPPKRKANINKKDNALYQRHYALSFLCQWSWVEEGTKKCWTRHQVIPVSVNIYEKSFDKGNLYCWSVKKLLCFQDKVLLLRTKQHWANFARCQSKSAKIFYKISPIFNAVLCVLAQQAVPMTKKKLTDILTSRNKLLPGH